MPEHGSSLPEFIKEALKHEIASLSSAMADITVDIERLRSTLNNCLFLIKQSYVICDRSYPRSGSISDGNTKVSGRGYVFVAYPLLLLYN
ncbi:MAG: hypothetical protein IJ796_01710 [Lachnospiraceae bacterium]|nr:hypothetical protein [Lachnospiraceae bacterium]